MERRCVIANRLSEDPDVSVLLLEAGKPEETKREIDIPGAANMLQRTEYDWAYR